MIAFVCQRPLEALVSYRMTCDELKHYPDSTGKETETQRNLSLAGLSPPCSCRSRIRTGVFVSPGWSSLLRFIILPRPHTPWMHPSAQIVQFLRPKLHLVLPYMARVHLATSAPALDAGSPYPLAKSCKVTVAPGRRWLKSRTALLRTLGDLTAAITH